VIITVQNNLSSHQSSKIDNIAEVSFKHQESKQKAKGDMNRNTAST